MDTTPKKRTLGDDFRDYLNGKIENKYYGGVRREFTGISDTTASAFGKRRNNRVKELDKVTDEEGNLTLKDKNTKQNRLSGSSLPLAGDEIINAQERALNKRKNDPATVPSYEQYIQHLADTYVVQTVPSKDQIQQYNADSKMLFEDEMQDKYDQADYETLMNASGKTESYREKQWLKNKAQEIATSSDLQGEKDDLIKQIDELANEIETAKPLEQDKLVKQREKLQQQLYNLEVNGIDTKIKNKKSVEDSEDFEKWKNKYKGYTYEELLKAQGQTTDDKEKQRFKDYAYEIGNSEELTAHRDKLKAEYDKLYSEINSYDDKKHDEALKHMMNIEDEIDILDSKIKSKKYDEDKEDNYNNVIFNDVKAYTALQKYAQMKSYEASLDGAILDQTKKHYTEEQIKQINDDWQKYVVDKGYDSEKLLKYYDREKSENHNKEIVENYRSMPDKGLGYAIAGSALSVPMNVFGGVTDAVNYIGAEIDSEFNNGDGYIDPNSTNVAKAQAIREGVQENMGGLGKFLYSTGMSMADFLSTAAISAVPGGQTVGLALLGTSAGVSAANDVIESGGDIDHAVMTGLAAGIAETVFEKFSLEQLKAFKQSDVSSVRNFVKNLIKGSFTEGSEEAFTDMANAITDQIINGDMSQLSRQYNENLANGMSEREAWWKTAVGFGEQTLLDFAGGALSGGVMSGGAMAINIGGSKINAKNIENKNARQIGEAAMDSEDFDIDSLINAALNTDKGSKAYKMGQSMMRAKKSGNSKSLFSPINVGILLKLTDEEYNRNGKVIADNINQQTQREKTAGNKNVNTSVQSTKQEKVETSAEIKERARKKYTFNSAEEEEEFIKLLSPFGTKNEKGLIANVLVNGKAKRVDGKIKRVMVDGIESSTHNYGEGNNKITLRLTDGTVMSADNIMFHNDKFQQLVNNAAKFETMGARAYVRAYEDYENYAGKKADMTTYSEDFNTMYDVGRTGITYDTFIKSGQFKATFHSIGEQAARQAIFAGNQDVDYRYRHPKNRLLKVDGVKGNVTVAEGTEFDMKGNAEVLSLLGSLSEKTGRDIVITDTLDSGVKGQFNPKTGKIYISSEIKSTEMLSIALHEAGHSVKISAPNEWRELEKFVVNYLTSQNKNVSRMIEEQMAVYRASGQILISDTALEEIVCNTLMSLASDEKALQTAIKSTDKNALKKIAEAIRKIVAKIKSWLSDRNAISAEAYKPFMNDINALMTLAEKFEKAAESGRGVKIEQKNNTSDGVKNYIAYTEDNRPVVVIEDNILNGVPKRYWVKTVKNTISEKFSNGIPIKGRLIKVNAITRDEFTKSKYSQHQKKYNKNIYKDKFKSANNLDEIIIASTNYVNEDLKHQRKDKFKEFARGDVLVKVGNNDYLAKVIVGITTSKSMVLYDVIDFTSTKFNIKKESTPYGQHKESIRSSMLSKKVDTHIAQQQNKNAESNGTSVSTSNNIPHKSDNVNNNSMQENENNASEIKYAVDDEIDDKYLEAVENNDLETAQKLVDEAAKENGYTIKAYHGTARADRVGNVFLPERATSGPMAFFTDSKEIASNYARDKQDTSLAYDEEYDDYYTQFRVIKDGKSISVSELWNTLPYSKRQEIKEKAKHITFDDNYENIIYDENAKYGLGDMDTYAINAHKGNVIDALVDSWLESGTLYENEESFLDVLKIIGLYNVEYRNPDARAEKVYSVYLNIQNVFDTSKKYNQVFIDGITNWAKSTDTSKYQRETAHADMWDKNNQSIEEWIEKAQEDVSNGTTYAWTSIPDSVTAYIKSQGYDGIKDTGGKNGSNKHNVYIPFNSEQIKSADPVTYDNSGNVIPISERFKDDKSDIRYAIDDDYGMFDDLFEGETEEQKAERWHEEFENYLKYNPEQALMMTYNASAKTAEQAINVYDVALDEKRVDRAIKKVWEKYSINANSEKLAFDDFKKALSEYVSDVRGGKITYGESFENLVMACKESLQFSALEDHSFDDFRTELKEICKNDLVLNEYEESEIKEIYGNVARYRNSLFGKCTVRLERNVKNIGGNKTGQYIDDIITELQNKFGEMVPVDMHSLEGLQWFERLVNKYWQPQYINPYIDGYSEDINTAAIQMAYDMSNAYIAEMSKQIVSNEKADKQQLREITRLARISKDEIQRLAKVKEVAVKENYRKKLAYEKERYDNKIKRLNNNLENEHMQGLKRAARTEQQIFKLRKQRAQLEEQNKKQRTIIANEFTSIRDQYLEKKRATILRNRLGRMLNSMSKQLDGKANNNEYIPESLKQPILDVLSSFAVDPGKTKYGKQKAVPGYYGEYRRINEIGSAVTELAQKYSALKKDKTNESDESKQQYAFIDIEELPYDSKVNSTLNKLSELLKGKNVYQLDVYDLEAVADAMELLDQKLKDAVTVIIDGQNMQIQEAAIKAINETEKVRFSKDVQRFGNDKLNSILSTPRELRNAFVATSLDPVRYGKFISGYHDEYITYKIFSGLHEGDKKRIRIMESAMLEVQRTLVKYKDKEIESLQKDDVSEFDFRDIETRKRAKITQGVLLAIYLTDKQADGHRHMINDKWNSYTVIPDVDYMNSSITKIKGRNAGGDKFHKIKLTESDIEHIKRYVEGNSLLKDLAKSISSVYNEMLPEEINAVSMAKYGKRIATVKNYYPLKVYTDGAKFSDKNFEAEFNDIRMKSRGFTKQREFSYAPIMIGDVLNTFQNHINSVSEWCGLLIPIENFKKIYNSGNGMNTLHETIVKKFGGSAEHYIEKLMGDLQKQRDSIDDNMFMKIQQKYMGVVLMLNPGAAVKQMAAFPLANKYFGHINVAKSTVMGAVKSKELCEIYSKYTPYLWYRKEGNGTIVGETSRQAGFYGKATDVLDVMGKMDRYVVNSMLYAAEQHIKKTTNLKPGTEEFYKEVAKLYEKVVDESQPNNMITSKPQFVRNNVLKTLSMNAFMSQTMAMGNGVIDSFMEWRARAYDYKAGGKTAEGKAAKNKAAKKFLQHCVGVLESALLLSGLSLLSAFGYHKWDDFKDEDGNVTVWTIASNMFEYFLDGVFGSFAWGKQIYEFIDAWVTGDTYYGLEVMSLSNINDIATDIQKGDFMSLAAMLSDCIGLPANNAYRIAKSISAYVNDMMYGNGNIIISNKGFNNVNFDNLPSMLVTALQKGDKDKAEYYEDMLKDHLMNDKGKSEKEAVDTIKGKIVSILSGTDEVGEIAKFKYNGELEKYESRLDKIVKQGFDSVDVKKAVDKAINNVKTDMKENGINDEERAIDWLVKQGFNEQAAKRIWRATVDSNDSNGKTVSSAFDETSETDESTKYAYDDLWNALLEGDDELYNEIYKGITTADGKLTDKNLIAKKQKAAASAMKNTSRTDKLWAEYINAVRGSDPARVKEMKKTFIKIYGSWDKALEALNRYKEKQKKNK